VGRTSDQVAWQAPLHVHHEDDEAWYVALRDAPAPHRRRGSRRTGGSGDRRSTHTFGNPSREPARCVLVMSATTNALLKELHGGFSGDVAALFEKYGCSLLD